MYAAAKKFSLVLVSGVASLVVCSAAAMAGSISLNFGSTGPGIQDSTGQGTGLTARLTNTGGALTSPNDSNLLLNTVGHTLTVTATPNVDFNGQSNMPNAEALGVNLSSLGYTGSPSQDFSVSASFTLPPSANFSYNQIGVYVGSSSTELTRIGYIIGSGLPTPGQNAFSVKDNGAESGAVFAPEPFQTNDSITATIRRVGGVFTETVTDTTQAFSVDVTPSGANPNPGTYLNVGDLNVGLYAITAGNGTFSVPFTSFTADVVTPEPGSMAALISLGLCGAAAIVRRRRRG